MAKAEALALAEKEVPEYRHPDADCPHEEQPAGATESGPQLPAQEPLSQGLLAHAEQEIYFAHLNRHDAPHAVAEGVALEQPC